MDLKRFVDFSKEPRREPEWKDAVPPSTNAWKQTIQTKILREGFLKLASSAQRPSTVAPADLDATQTANSVQSNTSASIKPSLQQEEFVPAQGSPIKSTVYLGYTIIQKPQVAPLHPQPSEDMLALEKTLLMPEPKGTRAEQHAAADAIDEAYNRDSEDSVSLPDYTEPSQVDEIEFQARPRPSRSLSVPALAFAPFALHPQASGAAATDLAAIARRMDNLEAQMERVLRALGLGSS